MIALEENREKGRRKKKKEERKKKKEERRKKKEEEEEKEDEEEEEKEEEPHTPAPVKRGRPKGSKDAQPRTRTKPVHTPSKQYVDAHDDTVHQPPPNSAALPSLRYFEEAMEHARQQEMTRRIALYTSWLPY